MSAENQEQDYLNMSDEELLNAPAPVPVDAPEDEEEDKEQESSDELPDPQDPEDEDKESDPAPQDSDEDAEDEEENKAKPTDTAPTDQGFDYKAEYERLLAPFKANGREIKVNGVEDAISLMQMGANYNKKMAALKPNLKLLKLLDTNGLLSEEKISFLIDLEKKNPQAITKLVKDSGLDPLELDTEKASDYKQTTYTVDDREVELDQVLDEIQGTPGYARTLDVVGNKWDAASKSVISGNPQILKVINDHMSSGIYDQIQQVIENERMYGRLTGVSDIEAYRQVGDALHAKGAFNRVDQGSSQNQRQQAQQGIVQPKPKQVDEGKLKDKKRAASAAKPSASNQQSADFNPLALSDEEFSKLVNKDYL